MEVSPEKIAAQITNQTELNKLGKTLNSISMMFDVDYPTMVDIGSEFGRALTSELYRLGWVDTQSYSYCTKATFESHLKKDGFKVNIISAQFLGPFTQIELTISR